MKAMIAPPAELSTEEARHIWRRVAGELAKTGILDWADRSTLAALCEVEVEMMEVDRTIAAEGGRLRKDKRGISRPHPLCKWYDQLFNRHFQLSQKLGMSPLARARLRNARMKMPRLRVREDANNV